MTSRQRVSGVLLHPTSLPSPYGVGDMGPHAHGFAHFLKETGQSLWQILPLNPPGLGHSPYSALSAFAGSPLLISPDFLREEGFLTHVPEAVFSQDRVDFDAVAVFKESLLRSAHKRFLTHLMERAEHDRFVHENGAWLEDFALFMALKVHHGNAPWTEWPQDVARRAPAALKRWRADLAAEIEYHIFIQFLFHRQWARLRRTCREQGVQLLGDIPIYVAHDSADVWAHQELFTLKEDGNPIYVAGVPPDYFSQTGQRWGNPLYDWKILAKQRYAWWAARCRHTLACVDMIRLDHFLAFSAYWEIPAQEPNAVKGRWVKGPGRRFFTLLKDALGGLPFLAENLGVVTPEAEALRRHFHMPGMAVLQFSFPPDHPPSHPYNVEENTFIYTGTHDNDTTVGWFKNPQVGETEKKFALKYLNTDGREIHWDFIRAALSSHARASVIPLQDVMGLGGDARMNFPGKPLGNWGWRFTWEQLSPETRHRLLDLTVLYGRVPKK